MNNVKHCDYVVMLSIARLATRGASSGGVCLSHGADTSRNWARIVSLHRRYACRQYTVFTVSLCRRNNASTHESTRDLVHRVEKKFHLLYPEDDDRLCGLVVRVSGYIYRGPGFDPRRYQIF